MRKTIMSSRRRFLASLATGAGLIIAARAAAAEDKAVEVAIDNFAFRPSTLTVAPGTRVTWTNRDEEPHLVVSRTAGLFKSPPLDTNDTFSFVFADKGSYEYFCTLHPHMIGTIVVGG